MDGKRHYSATSKPHYPPQNRCKPSIWSSQKTPRQNQPHQTSHESAATGVDTVHESRKRQNPKNPTAAIFSPFGRITGVQEIQKYSSEKRKARTLRFVRHGVRECNKTSTCWKQLSDTQWQFPKSSVHFVQLIAVQNHLFNVPSTYETHHIGNELIILVMVMVPKITVVMSCNYQIKTRKVSRITPKAPQKPTK